MTDSLEAMLLTEEEAKKKVCPIVTEHRSPRIYDCDAQKLMWANCHASGCMMWRWRKGSFFDTKRGFMVHEIPDAGVGHARGYCGLAGRLDGMP